MIMWNWCQKTSFRLGFYFKKHGFLFWLRDQPGTIYPFCGLRNKRQVQLVICWCIIYVVHGGSNYGDRCFAAAGPKLWNSLPADLRQAVSFQWFKRLLKTFFIFVRVLRLQRIVTNCLLKQPHKFSYSLTYYVFSTECDSIRQYAMWHTECFYVVFQN